MHTLLGLVSDLKSLFLYTAHVCACSLTLSLSHTHPSSPSAPKNAHDKPISSRFTVAGSLAPVRHRPGCACVTAYVCVPKEQLSKRVQPPRPHAPAPVPPPCHVGVGLRLPSFCVGFFFSLSLNTNNTLYNMPRFSFPIS